MPETPDAPPPDPVELAAEPTTEPAPASDVSPQPRLLHWSETVVRRRVKPSFPEEALAAQIAKEDCVMRVTVGPDGVPSGVAPHSCSEPFVASATEALLQWEFYPPLDRKTEGLGPYRVDITVKYRLR